MPVFITDNTSDRIYRGRGTYRESRCLPDSRRSPTLFHLVSGAMDGSGGLSDVPRLYQSTCHLSRKIYA